MGKTSLAIREALAMASGKALLGITPPGRASVWLWNGEDPTNRIVAAMLHYGLQASDVEGYLFTDTGREMPVITHEDRAAQIFVIVGNSSMCSITYSLVARTSVEFFYRNKTISRGVVMVVQFVDFRFFDGHCRNSQVVRGDGPSPNPGPSPSPNQFPLVLMRSVGQNGANIASDVSALQLRLNAVPTGSGGPNEPLVVDGIVGPKTIAAIQRFQQTQLGFQDGRVDPGGRTLFALNARSVSIDILQARSIGRSALVGASGAGGLFPSTEEQMVLMLRGYLAMVPTIRAAIMSARRRLANVERFVSNERITPPSEPGLDRERQNLALLDDTFGILQFDDPRPAFRKVQDIYETMSRAIAICKTNGDPEANGLFDLNTFERFNNPLQPAAYTARTGFHNQFIELQADKEFPELIVRTDRIFLTLNAIAFFGHRPGMITLIVHELAHWVSRPGDDVRDVRQGAVQFNDQPFRELPATDKIQNAENYGWFAARSFFEPFAF